MALQESGDTVEGRRSLAVHSLGEEEPFPRQQLGRLFHRTTVDSSVSAASASDTRPVPSFPHLNCRESRADRHLKDQKPVAF